MTRTRLLLAGVTALLVAALAGPALSAVAPPTVNPNGVENFGFTSHQRNHFGQPAKGFVIIEEWAEVDLAAPDAGQVRACARGFVTSQAKRIALRVNLRDDGSQDVLKASGSVNSNGGPLVSVCTAPTNPTDDFYVESVATIRWADDTLTSSASFGSTVVQE